MLILRDLIPGTKRFDELKKSIGNVSQKVLTDSLRSMEADGLVVRTVYAEVPPRVEYALSPLGESMKQSQADSGRHVDVGRELQAESGVKIASSTCLRFL